MDMYNEDSPVIVAQTGPFNGQRWAMQHDLLVGRDADCDIVITNRQVSRHHARFHLSKDGIWLEDLGSKNGTHHNGRLLTDKVMLQDGDVVQIALAQQFIFLSSDATLPLSGDLHLEDMQAAIDQKRRLHLEKKSRRVWVLEQEILPPLSVSQFTLLEKLYLNEGQVVSRADIIREVWGEENAIEISDQALDALVRRLRDRLAEADASHTYIATIRGHGLRLENPVI
jgi:pSer/pThr/pTyr-binding forkhead associated (FHA) protein